MALESIEGAFDAGGAESADVGVDHGGGDVGVAEQFLDGAEILTGFEEVGGEAMSEGMAGNFFGDLGFLDSGGDGGLDGRFVGMVSAELAAVVVGDELFWGFFFERFAGVGIEGESVGGEEVLPGERLADLGPFAGEGVGEPDPAGAGGQVVFVEFADGLDLLAQVGFEGAGEWDAAVFVTFGLSDGDLASFEVDIFDAESADFHDTESGAVHEGDHGVTGSGGDFAEDTAYFVGGQDDGEPGGRFGSDGVELEFGFEDFGIEKQECSEGLVLGTGSHMAIDGQVGEELIDAVVTGGDGVDPSSVEITEKEQIPMDPAEIGLLSPLGDVSRPHDGLSLIHQLRFPLSPPTRFY